MNRFWTSAETVGGAKVAPAAVLAVAAVESPAGRASLWHCAAVPETATIAMPVSTRAPRRRVRIIEGHECKGRTPDAAAARHPPSLPPTPAGPAKLLSCNDLNKARAG